MFNFHTIHKKNSFKYRQTLPESGVKQVEWSPDGGTLLTRTQKAVSAWVLNAEEKVCICECSSRAPDSFAIGGEI